MGNRKQRFILATVFGELLLLVVGDLTVSIQATKAKEIRKGLTMFDLIIIYYQKIPPHHGERIVGGPCGLKNVRFATIQI